MGVIDESNSLPQSRVPKPERRGGCRVLLTALYSACILSARSAAPAAAVPRLEPEVAAKAASRWIGHLVYANYNFTCFTSIISG